MVGRQSHRYDSRTTMFSPEGRLFQVATQPREERKRKKAKKNVQRPLAEAALLLARMPLVLCYVFPQKSFPFFSFFFAPAHGVLLYATAPKSRHDWVVAKRPFCFMFFLVFFLYVLSCLFLFPPTFLLCACSHKSLLFLFISSLLLHMAFFFTQRLQKTPRLGRLLLYVPTKSFSFPPTFLLCYVFPQKSFFFFFVPTNVFLPCATAPGQMTYAKKKKKKHTTKMALLFAICCYKRLPFCSS